MSIRRIRIFRLLRSRAPGVRRAKHFTICLTLLAAVLSASLVFSLASDQEDAIALLYEVMEKVDDSYARTPDFRKMYVAGLEGLKKSADEGRFDFEEKAGDEVLLKAGGKELLVRLQGDTVGGLGGFERAYRFAIENAGDSEKKKGGLDVMYAALTSMLRSLDPFSTFVTPESYRQMRVEHTGRYGGVGVIITVREKKLTIVSPIDDTPAHRAGLKSEDVILEIDGASTADMPLSEVVRRMRGPAGKTVDLLISRANWPDPRTVTLRRAIISIKSVKTEVKEGGIGYLRVTAFHGRTTRELDVALNDLIRKKVRGIVLDLRDNPGGFLRQSVQVSERFLPDGSMVVFTRGRRRSETAYFRSRGTGVWVGKPLVVLINKGSASASEIVAGALQDLDRALIIGRTSFGKGSVQAIIPTRGEAAVRLTTAKYYTPLGRLIHEKGIQPDVEAGPQPLTKKEIRERRREMKSSLYKKEEKTEEKKRDTVLELALGVLRDAESANVETLRRAALDAQRLMRSAEAVSSTASP